jgi:hypothetical protein
MFTRLLLPTIFAAACLGACATSPHLRDDDLRLNESPLEVRSLQSRAFEAPSEQELLLATIAVLQDMEYNVERVESPLGVITASKVADADSTGEQFGLFMVDLMCALVAGDCQAMDTASDEQMIMLTFVVQPSLANTDEFVARVTLQRVVYDTQSRVTLREPIQEPEMYQQIFDRLAKSIFLEIET